ncbi:hypothetical protein G647_06160 [Cladophialophora carrionii CBS 160.54]|uniref:MARVEL domain-containing protein n=1 Tax=Cladophialophora carrionii CBS 160.54 TaxID=1279043 RepID=V9D5B7_9EURO|nr:uncharacterized protein G647_06160 [Cladophialophora carrionii CBS 160.54]ETI22089.1 hypothetical protein G647_06160 [Cladophialophora carrionii CBS 160.54]
MAAALDSRRPVVPMPQWSNIIGCARAVVAILVLAFTAAATGIWGGAPGFGIALFTASVTLLVFAYYFVALSRSPALYNRWTVLVLESAGTFLWLVSLALLSGWSAHHRGGPPSGYGFWHAPFGPSDVGLQSHPRRSNRRAGIAFAGTAAGLSGLEFALFAVTLVTFGMGLRRQRKEELSQRAAPTTSTSSSTAVHQKEQEGIADEQKPEPVVV